MTSMTAPDAAVAPGSLRGTIEEGGNLKPSFVDQTLEETTIKKFKQPADGRQKSQMSPPISAAQQIIRKSRSLNFKESLPPNTTWKQAPRVPLNTIATEKRGSFLYQSILSDHIKGKEKEIPFFQKWSDFNPSSKYRFGFGSTSQNAPTGSSMSLVCQAIGREKWVLGGDTCKDCGTDC